ncbi:RNA-binding protein 7-like [Pholidichthys leucotaenia]
MGIEEEADRTVFVRNLDSKVTEELLFELFLQAGPLVKTKIPKDADGRQKTFGFAVYKHEVSVPYALQLLNGMSLYGRNIQVQLRSGSSHTSSPANSQNLSPASTPNPHGQRNPVMFGQRNPVMFSSPPYTPHIPRSLSSPDSLQKHVMMNMWHQHMQQMEELNSMFSTPLQRQPPAGESSGGSDKWQHDSTLYGHPQSHNNAGGRSHRRYSHHTPQRHHGERSSNRHHDGRSGNRHYEGRGNNRSYHENRWRRY